MNYWLIIDSYGQHIVVADDLDDVYAKDDSNVMVAIKLDQSIVDELKNAN